jgi:hypothetical protein
VILEKGVIPPNALFEKLNPAIDAEFLRVQVRTCFSSPPLGILLSPARPNLMAYIDYLTLIYVSGS